LGKAAADAIQAKEQGYQQGRSDTLGYLRKVVLTLAGEFEDDKYFKAYLRFVDEREWAVTLRRWSLSLLCLSVRLLGIRPQSLRR